MLANYFITTIFHIAYCVLECFVRDFIHFEQEYWHMNIEMVYLSKTSTAIAAANLDFQRTYICSSIVFINSQQ